MKTFLTLMIIIAITLAFALPVVAASNGGNAFALYSGASGAVKTSAVFNVRGYRTKTLQVSGATITSNASSTTFKNMSGTVLADCAPTTNGPWATCVQQDGTAVSLTSNGLLSWDDAVSYIRLKWTASTVGTKLKAFFTWLEL